MGEKIINLDEIMSFVETTTENNCDQVIKFGSSKLKLVLKENVLNLFLDTLLELENISKLYFENCIFDSDLYLNYDIAEITPEIKNENNNLVANDISKNMERKRFCDIDIKFIECRFNNSILFNDYDYFKTVNFLKCELSSLKIINAAFDELFAIRNCEIQHIVIFENVIFNSNCDFSNTRFSNNCVFNKCIFMKQGIFSHSIFRDNKNQKTGFDLSLSIINGNLKFFETNLANFKAFKIQSHSDKYDKALSSGKKIPIQNKRETFRIIKHQLIQQNNLIEAEKYAKLEKQTYVEEIIKGYKFNKISSLFSLFLSKISNNFKTSWLLALIFIFVIAFIFDIWLGNVSTVYLYTDNTLIKLINPTDFSFYDKFENNGYAYKVYLAGKIVIGFGIYQLIQAFRKFK